MPAHLSPQCLYVNLGPRVLHSGWWRTGQLQDFSITSSEPFCLGGCDGGGSSMQDCAVADPKGSKKLIILIYIDSKHLVIATLVQVDTPSLYTIHL